MGDNRLTLQQLGDIFGVSETAARQYEWHVLNRLRRDDPLKRAYKYGR